MDLSTVAIDKPEPVSVIIGQSHFIKTVEDIHEAMVNAVPASVSAWRSVSLGARLVRVSGTDEGLKELAARNAYAIGAGHTFVLHLAEGFYPINVLNALKMVPEVCRIFCATANPLEIVVAETALAAVLSASWTASHRSHRGRGRRHLADRIPQNDRLKL
jgi:adenosine/AMP kinase